MAKTRSKLVRELDRVFSIYIRMRDANLDGFAECVTCGKVDQWKSLQCGHFMSRGKYATRWDEQNCGTQCKKCNIFNQGEQFKFSIHLDQRYGEGSSDALLLRSNQTVKFSNDELKQMIEVYKEKIKDL